MKRYCVSCHNQRLKTGGLALDTLSMTDVAAGAETWEKVVRKLRTDAMPPAGLPRPEAAARTAFISYLETEIDRAAAANPFPGRTETVHRLNRAEYRNAIRDLLALDVDVASLLPADDMSYGFDNIAGVLKITPVAARSLYGRGAADQPAGRRQRRRCRRPPRRSGSDADLSQDDQLRRPADRHARRHVDQYQFPLDAEYSIKVEPLGGRRRCAPARSEHRRRTRASVHRRRPPAAGAAAAAVRATTSAGDALRSACRSRRARTSSASTFVKKSGSARRNACASRSSRRTPRAAPARSRRVGSVTIAGPSTPTGVSDTPSRAAHLRLPAGEPAGRGGLRAADPLDARAARVSPSGRPTRSSALLEFYNEGRATGGFESGIELALRRLLVSPEFLFRVEADPSGCGGRLPRIALSDLELASRLSFFLWSSIPDDELLDAAAQRRAQRMPAVLEQQVRRMLADPRSEALAKNFAGQWLLAADHRRLARRTTYLFPEFRREPAAATSGARPSSSSTASCARTAACSIC